ncbi:MAG: hypothetical protein HY661_02505 [Betaproteobacteria bacterium]|nr:hypothetical protein [Betaproteobacteria bacterium]
MKPGPAALSVFGDTGELDHVMYLVRNYAEQAKYTLSPDEWARARAASGLPYLEEKLGAAHAASEFRERDLNESDYLSVLHSVLQEALLEAMFSIWSGRDPSAWTGKKLDELNSRLLRVHTISGDIARYAVDTATKAHREGGEAGKDAATILLRDMASAYQRQFGRMPTARQLVDAMKKAGYIEDADANNLRLKTPDGRSAIIANDMKTIGDRLRNLKAKKTSRN